MLVFRLACYRRSFRKRVARRNEVLLKPVRESHLLRSLNRIFATPLDSDRTAGVDLFQDDPRFPDAAPGQGHILVAEDNLINQKVASLLLKKLGYTYDIVLMDCQMPEMGGFEAAEAIRATAGAGMNDYLAKPIDRVALALKLSQWILR